MGFDIDVSSSSPGDRPSGCGRLTATLCFGLFFTVGMLFLILIAGQTIRQLSAFLWTETACTIESSTVEQVDDEEDPYRLSISYRYEAGGREYRSTQLSLGDDGASSDYGTIQRLVSRFPAGSTATCWVDPRQPLDAVLMRPLPWIAAFVLLPLVFVAIGGGGLYFTWRQPEERPEVAGPLSGTAATRTKKALAPIILGAVFVAVGGALFVAVGILPGLRLLAAQSWLETPCSIVSSTVRAHESDDGTTYSIDILFEYDLEGRTWRSNRHSFVTWSSSGRRAKEAVVDRFPPGSATVCYVDPENPWRAVLDRELRPAYLLGLLPLLFVAGGVAAVVAGLRRRAQLSTRSAQKMATPRRMASPQHGPTALKPARSPAAKVIGTLLFAAFWNGITGVFVYRLVVDWMAGDRHWGLGLFMVPFVAVGLVALGMFFYYLLALANPRPAVTLSTGLVRLGDRLAVEWRFRGASGRIRALEITLEGREEATYRRGTSTHTDTEVFQRLIVASTTDRRLIALGSGEVIIPDDSMHSFTGENNRVAWSLKVSGDIPRWPDVDCEFPIEVRPMAIS